MKTRITSALILIALVISGCGGGNPERQVAQCINRNDSLETTVALDLCQGAYNNNGSYDHSLGDMFLVYMMIHGSWGYPAYGSPFTPYGRYNMVDASNTTIINNYGGASSISAKPTKPAKTSPLKSKTAGTKAPVASQPKTAPKAPKPVEPPKTSTVPKSNGGGLPQPAKPTPKPATPTPKPASKPSSPSKPSSKR